MNQNPKPHSAEPKSQNQKSHLLFADGTSFEGDHLGIEGYSVGEVIFNTAMTGYQEILTDPSYASQLICFTYPHIGNVGTNPFDSESNQVHASGVILRDYCHQHSNYRATQNLNDWLIDHQSIGIAGVDTRQITKMIRNQGAMNAVIYTKSHETEAKKALKAFKGLANLDLAKIVSTQKVYRYNHSLYDLEQPEANPVGKNLKFKVAVLDFGVKTQILKILVSLGAELTVFPAQTDFATLKKGHFDGIFLSNGPGDPEPCDYAIAMIREALTHKIPIFGICLGHQLLALALGAKTMKMKTGHHGANHPVWCEKTRRVYITSQNHGFCVAEPLPSDLLITHRSLFDQTIQGIAHQHLPAYGFQGHPEASPGPTEARELFHRFIEDMKQFQTHKPKAK